MVDSIELENERSMRNLRNKLDMDLFNLVGFDPEHCFYGNKNNGGYNFYNKRKIEKDDSVYNIDFNFKVLYEDDLDILYRYEKENDIENISDKELGSILKNIKDIKYVVIYGLYITPKNTGMGNKFINCFIDNLKNVGKIEKVFLSPKGEDAERFWGSVGFVKDKYCEISIDGTFDTMFKDIN
ncbi:hypothetical protein [Clostridium gasigenes]|uniref:hypothetical protein n=1 Tax=Clostridium gasigenes TaxID=94869 RepID=UPI001C0CCB37|nr:hypothetical protein [Clostridium gasigenes]MBU3103670.1 hypothetical protein [Clostridium gasigenes]